VMCRFVRAEQIARTANFQIRMAILKPLPSEAYCFIALMRLRTSVSRRAWRAAADTVGLMLVAPDAAGNW